MRRTGATKADAPAAQSLGTPRIAAAAGRSNRDFVDTPSRVGSGLSNEPPKNPELIHEASTGRVNRAVRALQLETELRTDPQLRADRFVERWQKLNRASHRQYQAGDMSGYKVT